MAKPEDNVKLAVMANDIKHINSDVKEIKEKLEETYITKAEFLPIRNLVYGLVALILTAVVAGGLALILR